MNGIKKFDIYSSVNEDNILLQRKTWVVNEGKCKTLMKTNGDITEILVETVLDKWRQLMSQSGCKN